MIRRTLLDRIHDRSWTLVSALLEAPTVLSEGCADAVDGSSISASHCWARVCEAFAAGGCPSRHFRRMRAVREIVETLGPVDGRYFARLVRQWQASVLGHESFLKIDRWGGPIRWPGILLGTAASHSSTSLRYLAHALWLRREGLVKEHGRIIEIGVGFGGLAAMNAGVSNATTLLVDLPQVEQTAMRMLQELGIGEFCRTHAQAEGFDDYCVVSNYAFTELSADLQGEYFERYIRHAARGVIISNANVFAGVIGGRGDEELLAWFQNEGLPATLERTCEILGPADRLCKVGLIRW